MIETNNHPKIDKKYRYTKQIIKLAIDAGYTNKDIAKKAGLSEKSIAQVSRWRRGESLATERQMRFFINEFSRQLKRKMEHLFTLVVPKNNEISLQYIKCTGDVILKHYCKHSYSQGVTKNVIRLVLLQEQSEYTLIFQYKVGCTYRKERIEDSKITMQNNGIVIESPKYKLDTNKIVIPSHKELFRCVNEEANWHAYRLEIGLSPDKLLTIIDEFSHSLLSKDNVFHTSFPYDAVTIPFIIRQTLLKQGYQAEDIIDLCSFKGNNAQTQ